MRRLLPLFLVLALAVAAVSPTTVGAATRTVRVGDNFFSPRSITISKGSTVKWRWVGSVRHNVVATRGARFRSGTKSSGTYSHTFRSRGTVRYVCTIHPSSMRGKIVVQ
jgi:plastocyanin